MNNAVIHVRLEDKERKLFDKFCKDNFISQRGAIMQLLKKSGYELKKEAKDV